MRGCRHYGVRDAGHVELLDLVEDGQNHDAIGVDPQRGMHLGRVFAVAFPGVRVVDDSSDGGLHVGISNRPPEIRTLITILMRPQDRSLGCGIRLLSRPVGLYKPREEDHLECLAPLSRYRSMSQRSRFDMRRFDMRLSQSVATIVLVFLAACNHEKVAPAQPSALNQPPPTKAAKTPPRDMTGDQKMSHSLALSSDIIQLCRIKATPSGSSPKFAFDQADLSDDDHNVLQQLAVCMRTGPLKGRRVELIGRADSRGTEEYNLALGSKRARSVNDYLQSLGVNNSFLSQTSRGALDATGIDEAGWTNDRRVDVMLKQS
jgi:outer membrane protein OmpA-like peptidoglycan-associated protein